MVTLKPISLQHYIDFNQTFETKEDNNYTTSSATQLTITSHCANEIGQNTICSCVRYDLHQYIKLYYP